MLRNLPNNYTRDARCYFSINRLQVGQSQAVLVWQDDSKNAASLLRATDGEVISWGRKKSISPYLPAPNLFPKRVCMMPQRKLPEHCIYCNFCWGHAVGAYWQLGLSRSVCALFDFKKLAHTKLPDPFQASARHDEALSRASIRRFCELWTPCGIVMISYLPTVGAWFFRASREAFENLVGLALRQRFPSLGSLATEPGIFQRGRHAVVRFPSRGRGGQRGSWDY